jgi:HK97 gp10 family phage protein
MDFKVAGFRELKAQLDRLPTVARQEGALKRAMVEALEPTAMLTVQMVPKRTGNLARSIIISDKKKGAAKEDGVVKVWLGASYQKGARGRHAHLVEFGTVKMAPRPFLRPAWDQDSRAMLGRLSDNLRKHIEAAIKRAGV